jgi:hypothetical protein
MSKYIYGCCNVGTWARTNTEKAQTFADHLTSVFQPHPSENPSGEEKALTLQLEILCQLKPPLSGFQRSEVQTIINNLKPKVPQATTSSWVKSFRNYLPLASNISHRYSMLPCSQDTSLHNGK